VLSVAVDPAPPEVEPPEADDAPASDPDDADGADDATTIGSFVADAIDAADTVAALPTAGLVENCSIIPCKNNSFSLDSSG